MEDQHERCFDGVGAWQLAKAVCFLLYFALLSTRAHGVYSSGMDDRGVYDTLTIRGLSFLSFRACTAPKSGGSFDD